MRQWECHDLPEPFWKWTQQPFLLPGHWFAALWAELGQGLSMGLETWQGLVLKPSQTPLGSTLHYPVQGKGSPSGSGAPCQAGAWPSSAPWPVQGGSLQGGFHWAGKQRPDGTQIPAQRHSAGWVCTAPMLYLLWGGLFPHLDVSCSARTSPRALPGSSVTLLARCLNPGCFCGEAALLQVSLSHSLTSRGCWT